MQVKKRYFPQDLARIKSKVLSFLPLIRVRSLRNHIFLEEAQEIAPKLGSHDRMSIKRDIGHGAIAAATIALVPGSIPFLIFAFIMRGIRKSAETNPDQKGNKMLLGCPCIFSERIFQHVEQVYKENNGISGS
jgi:hypothetical protein